MTRCIQCTRCVRFGQEIAGIMELGMVNRGEHSEIMTFMGQAVSSEMSGNVIDLCPVGALTSKPFRFRARSWEMQQHDGIAVHDTVGSNTIVETLRGEVLRVLPRDNESINEEWLSDRDRFSYTANESEQRLTTPMLKINGEWRETDWQTALDNIASKLTAIVNQFGAENIGALAAPSTTLEEFTLLAKIMRGLGSENVDYRLRQQDFRADGSLSAPMLGNSIRNLEKAEVVLLVGSNLRKEQPILASRLRKAIKNGSRVSAINSTEFDFAFPLHSHIAVAPAKQAALLAQLAVAIASKKASAISDEITDLAGTADSNEEIAALADSMIEAGEKAQIIVGTMAQMDANYSLLLSLAAVIAELTGANCGRLEEGNAVAAWQASFLPFTGNEIAGKNALQMLSEPMKACLLFNVEPSQDSLRGSQALETLHETGMVVHFGNFRSAEIDEVAHVMLPIASLHETDGSHVNCEGEIQSWKAATHPAGDSRPGWKVLRVLANFLNQDGFEYTTAEQVCSETSQLSKPSENPAVFSAASLEENRLGRIYSLPIYRVDAVTRRAQPLQQTSDNPAASATLHPETLAQIGVEEGATVEISHAGRKIEIIVTSSASVPESCVLLPTAMPETAELGIANWVEVKHSA